MLISVPVTLVMCHFWKLGWHKTCVGRRESNLHCGIVCHLMKDSWEVNCTYGFFMNAGNLILWNLWMKFTLQLPVKLGMGAAIVHRITGDTRAWEQQSALVCFHHSAPELWLGFSQIIYVFRRNNQHHYMTHLSVSRLTTVLLEIQFSCFRYCLEASTHDLRKSSLCIALSKWMYCY